MEEHNWNELLVSAEEFTGLKKRIGSNRQIRVNFLDHETLDQLYVMVFPNGSLVIPSGPSFLSYGPFLEIEDLEGVIKASQFDVAKHLRHSRGWKKVIEPA